MFRWRSFSLTESLDSYFLTRDVCLRSREKRTRNQHASPASASLFFCNTVTGRTVAELEVHTREFYSPVDWKEISSTSLNLTKSPLLSLHYLAYSTEPIYGHIYGRFSLSVQTRKLLALWHKGQKIEGKYLRKPVNKMPASCGPRYKTSRRKEQLPRWISKINDLAGERDL